MTTVTTVINMRDTASVAKAQADGTYIYVGRERGRIGPWGNRYTHIESKVLGTVKVRTREEAIAEHRKEMLDDEHTVERIRQSLAGKTLACWCVPLACHAQTLADIADGRIGG